MTDSESPAVQSMGERETNQQLQFDTDWDVVPPTGRNCHGCLKLDWESSTSRCVCHFIFHDFEFNVFEARSFFSSYREP